jgi:hypothetical protein
MRLSRLSQASARLLSASALLAVSACGGGGGDDTPRFIDVTVVLAAEGPIEGNRDATGAIAETDAGLNVGDREGMAMGFPRAFLSFNRSVIPPEATIKSAQLQLNLYLVDGNPFITAMGPLVVDWVNYGDTFPDNTDYAGNTILGNLATLATNPTLGIKIAGVTFAVQGDHTALRPSSQFRLRFRDQDNFVDALPTGVHFVDSEEIVAAGNPPALVVTYTILNPN